MPLEGTIEQMSVDQFILAGMVVLVFVEAIGLRVTESKSVLDRFEGTDE